MKRLLLILALAAPALAHPGVGIVVDSRGNIFYTDLKQVWRIAPDGSRAVVVPDVHTHELYLDAHDNLYGEKLWYNGDAVKTWGHYIWRLTRDGKVEIAVPTHEAFRGIDYSFVRDAAGNAYWPDRDNRTILRCSTKCEPLARASFEDIRWMTVTPRGTVYLVDLVDVVRITPDGRVRWLARNLDKRERHLVMGIWTDAQENAYVADWGDGAVKRIDKDGNVKVVDRSTFPWAPSGGTFDKNGDLLVLEYMRGPVLNVRVRRVRL